ncbi:hypothetical protein V8D89_012201 [Ganoderma adspersum]
MAAVDRTMWLLSTDRAELRYFARNFDATGGYAILSHTWDGDEQTLQEVRAIGERCRASGTNPRDDPELSSKIRNCCILVEKHGYRWVWIDSCCIDKTSSSELSEAINSMFRWYKEAEVCFAYLADVPSDCVLRKHKSAFRRSRWHTRGWTLQELIAPDFLIFLSAHWHELGNRADLAGLLSEITRVPSEVLTGEDRPAEHSLSIRMSWASERKTTRVEDEAYCLMGLFGVSMPTNYGEGKMAFIRLQYEIMQHNPDMSLFAFGYFVDQDEDLTFYPKEEMNNNRKYLLADSPRELYNGFGYIPDLGTNANQQYPPPLDSETTGPFDGGVELPRATVTSYGVELRVPIHEADGVTIAVILCQRNGRHFGLFLTRDGRGRDPKRPRYFTGCLYTDPDTGPARFIARMIDLGDDLYNLTFNGKPVKASWRTIYVVPTASDLDSGSLTTPDLIINCNPASRFRVPRWLIGRFTALQFSVRQLENTEMLQVLSFFLNQRAQIYVSLGSCVQHDGGYPDKPPQLWAKVDVLLPHAGMDTFTHVCSMDHIESKSWAARSKFFGDADRGVQLSLTPSTRMSDNSLVIHLQLLGRVLEGMLQGDGGLSIFPSLVDLAERDTPHLAPKDPIASSPSRTSSLQTRPTSSRTSSSAPSRNRPSASSPAIHSSASSPTHPSTASRGHSSTSTSASHTRFSRIPPPESPISPGTHVQGRLQKRHDRNLKPQPEQGARLRRQAEGAHRLQTPSPPPPTASGSHRRFGAPREREKDEGGLRKDPQGAIKDSDGRGEQTQGTQVVE